MACTRNLPLFAFALGLLLSLGVAAPARAQSCPQTAYKGGTVAEGTRVRVVAISSQDAYYPQRDSIIGKTGKVDRMDPSGSTSDCWFGGQFHGDDGVDRYFYQVALQVLPASGSACPAGAYTGAALTSGTRVRVLTVSAEDAYSKKRYVVEGKVGKTDGNWKKSGSPCWYTGQFYGDDGTSAYFYQASVQVMDNAEASACPTGSATVDVPAGTRVKVLALAPDDAYYGDKDRIVGKTGKVTDALHPNHGCWMGGGVTADDGTYYYFYKAAVEPLNGQQTGGSGGMAAAVGGTVGCPANTYLGDPPALGTRVKIVALSDKDTYYGTRSEVEGQSGRVDGAWTRAGSTCWYGGQFQADNGNVFELYRAAIQITNTAAQTTNAAAATCPPGAATTKLADGTRVKVLAIHPDDSYYQDFARITGETGKVTGDLHPQDGCWLTGGFTADNGTYYHFYKAALVPLESPAPKPAPHTGTVAPDGGVVGGVVGGTRAPKAAPPTGQRFMGDSIPNGQRFRVVALAPDDSYYAKRATIIGRHCTATAAMPSQGPGWYSGPTKCTDGSTPYFYKVGVVFE